VNDGFNEGILMFDMLFQSFVHQWSTIYVGSFCFDDFIRGICAIPLIPGNQVANS
jgi:hypothetical protein